jgi:hypothetical protein
MIPKHDLVVTTLGNNIAFNIAMPWSGTGEQSLATILLKNFTKPLVTKVKSALYIG